MVSATADCFLRDPVKRRNETVSLRISVMADAN